MLKVTLDNDVELELPEPSGEYALQAMKVNTFILDHEVDMNLTDMFPYIDDMIFLLLNFWKEEKLQQPFDKLVSMCEQDVISFKSEKIKVAFKERVIEDKGLISDYSLGDGDKKTRAKDLLKERGFFGIRKTITPF